MIHHVKFIELLAPAARTSSSSGSAVNIRPYALGEFAPLKVFLSVGAASGTSPTLDVTIQQSPDGSTGWTTVGSFTQMTGTGSQEIRVTPTQPYIRVAYTIAGTSPSFTFHVTALAVDRDV